MLIVLTGSKTAKTDVSSPKKNRQLTTIISRYAFFREGDRFYKIYHGFKKHNYKKVNKSYIRHFSRKTVT